VLLVLSDIIPLMGWPSTPRLLQVQVERLNFDWNQELSVDLAL